MTEIKEKISRPIAFLKFLPFHIAHIAKAPQAKAETNPEGFRVGKECNLIDTQSKE